MLTSDLVRVRESKGVLRVTPLSPDQRARLKQILEDMIRIAEHAVGESRQTLMTELDAVPTRPAERKLGLAARKLVIDACEFDTRPHQSACEIRSQLFRLAAHARLHAETQDDWDRSALVQQIAASRETTPEQLEQALFSDLPSEHTLLSVRPLDPINIVNRWEILQTQAVLLKATRVEIDVREHDPATIRNLFRWIKFLRLLPRIERSDTRSTHSDHYRITLDGPLSLFGASTKYGMQLANLLPRLEGCHDFSLRAELRWGPQRSQKLFEASFQKSSRESRAASPSAQPTDVAALPTDLQELLARWTQKPSAWHAEISHEVFHVPDLGVCVPDLVFTHNPSGQRVWFELLGYWSRDAVWNRVELAHKGLSVPMLFAVSNRLRVSEDVLADHEQAKLLVFKHQIRARDLQARLDGFLTVD